MSLKPELHDLRSEHPRPALKSTTHYAGWFRPQPALWLGLRLALGILGIYFLKNELTWLATILAIHLVGSWPERLVLSLVLGLALAAAFKLAGRFTSHQHYLAALGMAFGMCLLLFLLIPGAPALSFSLFLVTILAANTLPEQGWAGRWGERPRRWLADFIFIAGIGWAEVLLFRPFVRWFTDRQGFSKFQAGSRPWLTGVMLVALLGALLPSAANLASLHRALFPDPAVEMVAQGNLNGLELNLERRVLYTAGYGTNYLRAYNLDELTQPPLQSPVESDYAQGFGYNSVEQEIYVYNQQRQQLLFLDATTLALKKTVAIPQLAPGDAWVVWDKFSDRIIIASEADEPQGIPFMVIERQSREVISTLDLAPGFILPHPTKPLFYMTISFFQDQGDLIVYDIMEGKVTLSTPMPTNLDRLAFASYQGELELLAPSALGAEVLRFDPGTLVQKGAIPSLFGARAIAVDPVRRLLLVGSLVTHRLEVVDLDSHQRLAVYYIGPWLRSLSLDVEAGQAYLSTHEGVFTIQYSNLLQRER